MSRNTFPALKLAKGFLMHKMYHLDYAAGRHTSVDNLPKSCPLELRSHIPEAVLELKRENLLIIRPTSYGDQVTAVRDPRGYEYANIYENHAGLPLLQFGQPSKQAKARPLSKEELRKLAKRK